MCCRIRKKLVIIGDEGCGKTCLLTVSLQGQFPESPGGGLGSVHNIDLKVDRRKFRLISWDTKGIILKLRKVVNQSEPKLYIIITAV